MSERGLTSEEAVKRATGKTWSEWFAILTKAGGKKMAHIDRVRLLGNKHIKSGWWAQMVTVEYEREYGLRKMNENAQGFNVSIHKTVAMALPELEKEWERLMHTKEIVKQNLEQIPSKTKRNMLRYKAKVGGVVVSFDPRPKGKSRIMVESIRLPKQSFVEPHRAFWKKVLEGLE